VSTNLSKPSASVEIAAHTVKITQGTVVLDETREYATASLTIPLVGSSIIEAIDPRDNVRAWITAAVQGAPARTFALGLRRRTVDHKRKTISLVCASDETLLGDYAPLSDDESLFALQGSLRDVINHVLDVAIPGATLEPGDDATATAYANATNLIPDPSNEGDGLTYQPSDCSIDRDDTSWAAHGSSSINLYSPIDSDAFAYVGGDTGDMRLGMSAGRTYVLSATGRVKAALSGAEDVHARRLTAWYYMPTANEYTPVVSEPIPTTVGVATRVSVRFTIPREATEAFIRAYHGHGVGEIQWDAFRLTEYTGDPTDTDYFDGSSADTDGYAYAWTGDANASTSTRVALIDRAPESLLWKAGTSAWDLLLPLTASARKRLFCDETRAWRLVDQAYAVPGVVVASPLNSREGSDTINRDGDAWADGVIARYRWTGRDGSTLEQLDAAGSPGKVRIVDFDRPYPGPGAAAFILNRMQGQGRSQDAVASTVLATSPGMEARVTLPGTIDQIGRVQRVEFDLKYPWMTLGTRGLTDTPPTAYIFGDPGISYDDVPVGMSYDEFDWSEI
jgi:hypothetical protein